MTSRMTRIACALVAIAVALGTACTRPVAPAGPVVPATPPEVVTAAKAAVETWRAAYETKTLETIAPLYSHDLDLAVIHEGVQQLGWSSVEAMLKDRFVRSTKIHVRLKDIQVTSVAPDVATAVATMTRELVEGSSTLVENGTLSLVFKRTATGWLIVLEHYSYRRST